MRNLKRALSLALASVMLLGMMVVGTNAGYADVDKNDNVEAIEVMKLVGVMTGDDKGNFNPDQVVTRNEMAVVICNLLGLKANDFKDVKLPFTDVAAWAQPYVAAILSRNITAGTSATTFGGEGQVTVLQASLMMMKALGYFQNQGDFQPSWELATATQASSLKLLKGVEGAANSGMTRNEVAQLGLNTLNTNHVKFTGDLGTDIKLPDGTTIQTGYNGRYEAVTPGETLAVKLYGDKLTKNEAGEDVYGRPAVKYTYKNKSVTVTKTPDAVVYNNVKDKAAVAKVLGVKQSDIKNTTITAFGGNGLETSIYKDDSDYVYAYSLRTHFGEVADVKKADKDNETRKVTIDGKQFETELFAKHDKVLYTLNKDQTNIETVELAEKLTGKLTKIDGAKYTIDGQVYELYDGFTATGVKPGNTVDFYLCNGYIIDMAKSTDEVKLDNLAYVVEAGKTGTKFGVNKAELVFADGTKKIVDTDKNYSTNEGDLVTFKVNEDGQYKLTYQSDETQNSFAYNPNVPTFDGKNLDNATVMVYVQMKDGEIDKIEVFNGFKAASKIDTTSVKYVTYAADPDEAVDLVIAVVDGDKVVPASQSKNIFVAANKDASKVIEADEVTYYEYKGVVDGKVVDLKLNDKLDGKYFFKSIKTDKNGVSVLEEVAEAAKPTTVDNKNVKYAGGVISIETVGSKAAADDAVIYVVAKDGKSIEIIAAADIVEAKYNVQYKLNDDTGLLETLVLIEK